jgi:hypothetical protein
LDDARTFVNRLLPIAFLAVLGTTLAAVAQAQATTPPTPGAPPAWRSAFDGYQPFSDEKTLPWRQANDTVQGVGGWRAYAREAAQPASAAAPAPAPKAGSADPHGAHHKQ